MHHEPNSVSHSHSALHPRSTSHSTTPTPPHPLHEKALTCARNYKRAESELLDALTAIDQSKLYLTLGVSSLFRYCVEKLNLSESDTYRFTQVTRKSYEVPELKKAIASGTLTVSKASRIAPILTQSNQAEWLAKAETLTHRELEREVAKVNPKPLLPERIAVKTSDRFELRMNISIELEKKLKRLQEVLRTQSLEATLEKMAEITLKHKDPLEKAKRNHTKPATWQVQPVAKEASRARPAAICHEVALRDQGRCMYPGCGETRWVEVHHIKAFATGGKHEVSNLITLCSGHHALLHDFAKSAWGQKNNLAY